MGRHAGIGLEECGCVGSSPICRETEALYGKAMNGRQALDGDPQISIMENGGGRPPQAYMRKAVEVRRGRFCASLVCSEQSALKDSETGI